MIGRFGLVVARPERPAGARGSLLEGAAPRIARVRCSLGGSARRRRGVGCCEAVEQPKAMDVFGDSGARAALRGPRTQNGSPDAGLGYPACDRRRSRRVATPRRRSAAQSERSWATDRQHPSHARNPHPYQTGLPNRGARGRSAYLRRLVDKRRGFRRFSPRLQCAAGERRTKRGDSGGRRRVTPSIDR